MCQKLREQGITGKPNWRCKDGAKRFSGPGCLKPNSLHPSVSSSVFLLYLSPVFLTHHLCHPLLFHVSTKSSLFSSLNLSLLISLPLIYPVISYLISPSHTTYCPRTFCFQHIHPLLYIDNYSPCLASIQHNWDCYTLKHAPFFDLIL